MTVGKDDYKFATVHSNGGHPYASATSVEFSPYTAKIAGFKINLTGTGFSIAPSVSIKQTDQILPSIVDTGENMEGQPTLSLRINYTTWN